MTTSLFEIYSQHDTIMIDSKTESAIKVETQILRNIITIVAPNVSSDQTNTAPSVWLRNLKQRFPPPPAEQMQRTALADLNSELLRYANHILTAFFDTVADRLSRQGQDESWIDLSPRRMTWWDIMTVLRNETRMRIIYHTRLSALVLDRGTADAELASLASVEPQVCEDMLLLLSPEEVGWLQAFPHEFPFYNRLARVLSDLGFSRKEEFSWVHGCCIEVATLVHELGVEQGEANEVCKVEKNPIGVMTLFGEHTLRRTAEGARASALQEVGRCAGKEFERRESVKDGNEKKQRTKCVGELDEKLVW